MNDDERELMAIYGPCEHCGAPRKVETVTSVESGEVLIAMRMVCTRCGKPHAD